MATDDQNKEREEDDFFGDDEDFGLPELDYEALDDDSDDAGDDEMSFDNEEVGPDAEDDFDDMDASFEDEQEIISQTDEEGTQNSEAEVNMAESEESFEEESFDDFNVGENGFDTESEDFDDSAFDSDTLGDDEFKEFEGELMDSNDEFKDSEIENSLSSDDSFAMNEEYSELAPADANESGSKGKFARIIVIGIAIFLAAGTLFYFFSPSFSEKEGKAEIAENKQTATPKVEKEPITTKKVENPPVEQPEEIPKIQEKDTQSEQPRKVVTNNTPKARTGEITSLTRRTGNFYIIVASFLDGDLATSHSKNLAASGRTPIIIPPFGKAVTHRVAIQGYGSLSQAQDAIDGYKGEYGQDIWILRY
ncbi:MAG: SPOR domain-containing protein [Ekhidna sp.]|nr:SPOR domain-containing protein [Ekhidna sp.]